MARKTYREVRLSQAKDLLEALGLPEEQQNDRSAWVLLALAGIKPSNSTWKNPSSKLLTTRQIMDFIRDEYGKEYAANSRETIRRKTLHQFEQAALVARNVDMPDRSTNSGANNYSLTAGLITIIEEYPKGDWKSRVANFLEAVPSLRERYRRDLELEKVPVVLPDGVELSLSPGLHNELHALVVHEFLPRFLKGGRVLYLGDTASSQNAGGKMLHFDSDGFDELNCPQLSHEKLPDLVCYEPDRNWLFLIEAVTSHGPISEKRLIELDRQFTGCRAGLVYVTAFLDRKTFRKFSADIAWETEVWIADRPDHLIHYNGDRFLGPR